MNKPFTAAALYQGKVKKKRKQEKMRKEKKE